MKIEPWPGGRWYRDLGDNNGHFWGHVQAIKRPTLLEITGPLFASYPFVSNVQYRLSEKDGGTLISLPSHGAGVHRGPAQRRSRKRLGLHARASPQTGRGCVVSKRRVKFDLTATAP